jgi:drug/metabolite transporter (DMT)-like permease
MRKSATHPWAIVAVLLCTLFFSAAQIFYKFGIKNLTWSTQGILLNYNIWVGLFLYAVGAAIMIVALRYGELSVLYPLIASGYVWVALLSAYLFHEPLSAVKWIGIGILIAGMFFVGMGSRGAR